MTTHLVIWALTIGAAAALQCFNGTQGVNSSSVTLATCDDNVVKCKSPNGTVVDNTYTTYGCGACAAEDKGCVDCDTDSCNKHTIAIVSYNCTMGDSQTTCQRNENENSTCFSPAKDYMGDDMKLKKGGCGSCASIGQNSTVCTDCVVGSTCSGAITNIASLVLVAFSLLAWF